MELDFQAFLHDKPAQLATTAILCSIFAFLGTKKQWFTLPASITIGALALIIVYKHDILLLLFPFLFAFIGSLISSKDPSQKKGRSVIQVLANAAPALLIILFIQDPILSRNMVILVFAVALADTMSSELGRKWKGTTIDFCSMKKMQPGLSGGISLQGTFAGLLGSLIIAAAALIYGISTPLFFMLLIFGFVGMLIDSIFGSIAQGKYMVGKTLQETGSRDELVRGLHWLNNEATNFISIVTTVVIAPL